MRMEIEIQGKPRISDVGLTVRVSTPDIVAVEIDMSSKWCEVDGTYTDGDVFGIEIVAGIMSQHLDDTKESQVTLVKFPDMLDTDWELFTAQGGRYTIRVVFIKKHTNGETR